MRKHEIHATAFTRRGARRQERQTHWRREGRYYQSIVHPPAQTRTRWRGWDIVVLMTAQMAGAGSSRGVGLQGGDGGPGRRGSQGGEGPRKARGPGRRGAPAGEGRQGRRGARGEGPGAQGRMAPGRGEGTRAGDVHAEGGRACGRAGQVPEVPGALGKCQRCQARAVVRTYLMAFLVLSVLRREARKTQNIQPRVRLDLHGRHDAQGSLGGEARREVRLL